MSRKWPYTMKLLWPQSNISTRLIEVILNKGYEALSLPLSEFVHSTNLQTTQAYRLSCYFVLGHKESLKWYFISSLRSKVKWKLNSWKPWRITNHNHRHIASTVLLSVTNVNMLHVLMLLVMQFLHVSFYVKTSCQ